MSTVVLCHFKTQSEQELFPDLDPASFQRKPPLCSSLLPRLILSSLFCCNVMIVTATGVRGGAQRDLPVRRVQAQSVCANSRVHCFKAPRAVGLPADSILQRGRRNSEIQISHFLTITKRVSRAAGFEARPPTCASRGRSPLSTEPHLLFTRRRPQARPATLMPAQGGATAG